MKLLRIQFTQAKSYGPEIWDSSKFFMYEIRIFFCARFTRVITVVKPHLKQQLFSEQTITILADFKHDIWSILLSRKATSPSNLLQNQWKLQGNIKRNPCAFEKTRKFYNILRQRILTSTCLMIDKSCLINFALQSRRLENILQRWKFWFSIFSSN